MALLEIVEFPDKRLREKCETVTTFDDNLRKLASDMAETMYAAPGIGLAAIQVGELIRMLVCDVSGRDEEPNLMTIVNPEIIESDGLALSEEGCLSVPGAFEEVKRAATIELDYQTLDGEKQHLSADGMLAICLQHEIDHLNGVLFIDHLSTLKRKLAARKVERFKKERARSAEPIADDR